MTLILIYLNGHSRQHSITFFIIVFLIITRHFSKIKPFTNNFPTIYSTKVLSPMPHVLLSVSCIKRREKSNTIAAGLFG